jgi:hypothetical protein
LVLACASAATGARQAGAVDSSASAGSGSSPLAQGTIGGKPISITDIDFSVPESPALAVLGTSTTKVVRPATPKELVTHLLQGTDSNGVIQTGLALDLVPYLLLAGNQATLEAYNRSSGFNATRTLSNIQLSFGSVKDGSAGSNAVRVAGGLRYVVFDLGDPRSSSTLFKCFESMGKPDTSKAKTEKDLEDAFAAFAKDQLHAYQTCLAQQKLASWNRSAMEFGVAPSWTSATGSFSDLKHSTMAYYFSAAYGFERVPWLQDNAQLIGHLQSTVHEVVTVPASSGTSYTQNSTTYGLKLRICADRASGTPKTYISLEADRIQQRPDGQPSDSYRQFSITAERQIAANLYLNLQVGGTSKHPGSTGSNGGSFVLGGLKWSLDQSSQVPADALKKIVGETR